jgi:THO complex subunit 4
MWLHDKAPGAPRAANTANGHIKAEASLNSKLLVSNLHYEITPKDLTAIFGQIGTLVREPLIRYDRSGRSSGVAIISFETPAEATRAKKQFDGILAKGQPMSITYDFGPPRMARRVVSAPGSLLNRIQKPPLADRLSLDDSSIEGAPSYVLLFYKPLRLMELVDSNSGPGPIRSKRRTARVPKPRKPKTAEDLDNELDLFMGDGTKDTATAAAPAATQPEGDVEMA